MLKRIILLDDHPTLVSGLYHDFKELDPMLEIFQCSTSKEVLTLLDKFQIDCLVTDYFLPNDSNGIELCFLVKKRYPAMRVVLFTMVDSVQVIRDAIAADVDGFILKKHGSLKVYQALIETGNLFSPEITRQLALKSEKLVEAEQVSLTGITNQEMEVMTLIAKRKSIKQIADILCVEASTVYSHRAKLYEKLNTDSNVGIAHYAYRYKIVSIDQE